jgi:RimJ/RimL family protein N-acetyltransferase
MGSRLEGALVGDTGGMEVTVREAEPSDAARIIAYLQELAEEPDINLPVAPGEFSMTVEEEEEFIRGHAEADNMILLVAVAGEQVIGVMNITGGRRKAMRHAGKLGISVHKDWRGRGIGTRMLQHALDWARNTGILTRVQLEVYARNIDAVKLYERFGFKIEGRHPRAFYQHGQYLDEISMGLLL